MLAVGGVVVVLIAIHAVSVQHQCTVGAGGINAGHRGAPAVDAVVAQFGAAFEGFVERALSDAAVDDIDHAADRAAAVQQGRRAFQDFDLVGEEGLDRRGVVLTDGGHVLTAQPTGQHANARAVEAADDRTTDASAEVGALHARQLAQRFAEGGGFGLIEPLARQHVHRLAEFFGGQAQRAGGHHHAIQVFGLIMTRIFTADVLG